MLSPDVRSFPLRAHFGGNATEWRCTSCSASGNASRCIRNSKQPEGLQGSRPLGPRDQLQPSQATRRVATLCLSNGGLSVFLCGRLMSGAGWPVSTLSYLEL